MMAIMVLKPTSEKNSQGKEQYPRLKEDVWWTYRYRERKIISWIIVKYRGLPFWGFTSEDIANHRRFSCINKIPILQVREDVKALTYIKDRKCFLVFLFSNIVFIINFIYYKVTHHK